MSVDQLQENHADLLPILTRAEMQQHWTFCPAQDLPNLFYYNKDDGEVRVCTYTLPQDQLIDLFDYVGYTDDIQIRVYMAARPDIEYGDIKDLPSFVPIIQAFKLGQPTDDISINSFIAEGPDEGSDEGPSALTAVSKEAAQLMVNDWYKYLAGSLSQLFEWEGVRLNYTTFDKTDSNKIRAFFTDLKGNQRSLKVHLGFHIPTAPVIAESAESAELLKIAKVITNEKPFGFRIILEIRADLPGDNHVSNYYEFSNPCPPFC